jgi:phage protein U
MTEIILGEIKIAIPPERKIDFSGMRTLVKYDVPGDRPRYQDMGRDERTVRWSGIFYGDGAYDQALTLQEYYDSGKNIDDGTEKSGFLFMFEDIVCRVLIKSYVYQYYRADKVRYDIELVRLESDYDKEKPQQKAKTDKIAKAKTGLDKLKDDINKAMKVVNDVSKAAQSVQESLYKARRDYLSVVRSVTTPIANMRKQVDDVKYAFDKSLATVNHSVGRVSTPANRQELKQALQTVQTTIPLAQALVVMAQQRSLGPRTEELIAGLPLRPVLPGETLRSIATEVLGSPHQWMLLAQINRLPSSIIPEGTKSIRVPDTSNLAELQSLLDEQMAQLPAAQSDYLKFNER